MRTDKQFPLSSVLLAGLTAGLLSGCSASFVPSPVQPEQVPIGNIQGSVHGGQAPVSGARIYLYAAGTGGYGTNATSLICDAGSSCPVGTPQDGNGNYYVTTDSNGNFALSGDYTCTAGTQVYMVAVGGNPGLTPVPPATSVDNEAIVQMAGLGQCPAAGNLAAQVPYLVINEVTTVAFAYSMGGFATNAYNVSSNAAASAASATAIANAMANTHNIVNLQWGQAPAVANGNPNSVNPQAKIYALANILATCVNVSDGGQSACTSLFNAAKNSAGVVPTDEATAIFNIVHSPANSSTYTTRVSGIWTRHPSQGVFSPDLSTMPADWTLPVIYTGLVSIPPPPGQGGAITTGPYNIAFDAKGNAWIGDRVNGVVEVGPQGATNTYDTNNLTSTQFGMIKGVAVSPADGTIWATDFSKNTVYVMNSAGVVQTSITTDLTGNGPILTAFAANPNGTQGYLAYEANENATGIVLYDASSYAVQTYKHGASYTNITTPGWIAVDAGGTGWIPSTSCSGFSCPSANVGALTVVQQGNGGVNKYGSSQNTTGIESYSLAGDSRDLMFQTGNNANELYEITSGASSTNAGGMNAPYKLAIDGNNTVWIANDGANTISAANYSLTSQTFTWLANSGFSTSAASGTGCVVIGIDGSGNVWTGNSDGSVTQILGLATPTATPFYGGYSKKIGGAVTVTNGNLGIKP